MQKRIITLLVALCMLLPLYAQAAASTGTGTAQGYGGDVIVTLTVEDGVITALEAKGEQETAGIGGKAIEEMVAAMLEKNTVEVDTITEATKSGKALLEAAAAALENAGLKPEDLKAVAAPAEEAVGPAFADPDVIVVGAGFSGINAAIAAADSGAKVYLIEKTASIGGSIRFAGGTTSAAGAQMQKDAGVEDSPENFLNDIVRMGGGTNIEELTRRHTERAAAAIDWLDGLGADFGDRQPKMSASYDAFNTPREYRVTGGGSALLAAVTPLLDQHIADGNVALMTDTQVKDIIVEDGAVKGVVLNDEAGTEYRAPATVLATGGYGHNEALINEYNFANVLTMAPSFVTGDGFNFALKAGAVLHNMDYLPAYPGGVPVDGFDVSCTAVVKDYPNVIWVNNQGERIVKEFDALDSERKNAYASAPENLVYILLTEEVKTGNEAPLLKVGGGFSGKADEGWAYFDEMEAANNCVFSGATIAEVAEKAGVNAEGLQKTVEKVNGFIDAGADADFGRDTATMMKLDSSKYYLVKTCPYVMLTKGGPLMSVDAEVLNADSQPIPGLYQCGELVGGGNIGGSANIGGLANTICMVWGKIAGENAAAFAQANK